MHEYNDIFQYLRAGYHVPIARPLTMTFAIGFGIAVALWGLSILIPPPWRFALWAIAMGIDFATPIVAGRSFQHVPPHMAHVSERLGLFTIIVLGESVVAVVRGISGQELGLFAGETGLLGLVIAFSLWWIYFDSVDASPLESYRQGRFLSGVIWLYTHLLFILRLAATGVGVYHLIFSDPALPVHTAERWLMSGALALCFLALGILHLITVSLGHPRQRTLIAAIRFGTAAFLLILAIAGTTLTPLVLMGMLAIVSGSQVGLDLLCKARA
nr:low temperature requirement protein A [Trichothermofontia sichuanensis]